MSSEYEKLLNALPRPDLYDSWELVKRHMPIEQPPSAASYIVFQKGGQCYAKNGMTGHIEFGPGDASTVIQTATNALTNGGKIFIKAGTYLLTSTLYGANGVHISGEGALATKLKVADGLKIDALVFDNKHDFSVHNLEFDGNGASLAAGTEIVDAIVVKGGSSKFTLENIVAHDFGYTKTYGFGFDLIGCSDGVLFNLSGYNNGSHTFALNNVTRINGGCLAAHDDSLKDLYSGFWVNGDIVNLSDLVFYNEGYGLHLEAFDRDVSKYNFANVIIQNVTYTGVRINTVGTYNLTDLKLKNLQIHGVASGSGIEICRSGGATGYLRDIDIEATIKDIPAGYGIRATAGVERLKMLAKIRNCSYDGISLDGVLYAEVLPGSEVIDCSQSGLYSAPGIRFYNSSYGKVIGVTSFDTKAAADKKQEYGILEQGSSDYNVFAYNYVVGNKTANISRVGANTIVRRNIGYVTENSGTATFSGNGSQTQFTIAHGLAGTPKSWCVEAGSADAKGDKYVTADATNLTVTFAAAPPSGTNNVVLVWQAEM
jgi:hypothetical protein